MSDEGLFRPYDAIGGEDAVRRLVNRFYDLMDSLPEAADVRALHPGDLKGSRTKLFWFMSGWLGGPPLYVERYGHPRLRARHLPFAIGQREADQWMLCMDRALDELVPDETVRAFLKSKLGPLAQHMRNQPE